MLYNNRVQCDIIYIVEEGIALMKGSEEMQGMTRAELERFEAIIRENEKLKNKVSELEEIIKQLSKTISK